MAKFRVERGGGEYVFPSIGIIANDGDVVDLPDNTDISGLVLVSKSTVKSVSFDSESIPTTVTNDKEV